MSDYTDTADLLKRLGIVFEEKEYAARKSIFIEAGGDVLGYTGSYVEFKFRLDGSFDRAGIYPKEEPKKEERPEDYPAPPGRI